MLEEQIHHAITAQGRKQEGDDVTGPARVDLQRSAEMTKVQAFHPKPLRVSHNVMFFSVPIL